MVKTYFGASFLKSKFDGLDGKVTITYVEQSEKGDGLTITLKPSGMKMSGELQKEIVTEADLQDYARLISDAWVDHRSIAPKILRGTLAGH